MSHETDDHKSKKAAICSKLREMGLESVCEHNRSDIVAWRVQNGALTILCVEYERSEKHCLANARKDFARNCDELWILAANEGVLRRIKKKMGALAPEHMQKTKLLLIEEFLNGEAL